MEITKEHVASKHVVGKEGEDPIYEIVTTGGLYMIVKSNRGKGEILSTGSHPAISRHIARKRAPSIVWTDLRKSDGLTVDFFSPKEIEYYERLTDVYRKHQG